MGLDPFFTSKGGGELPLDLPPKEKWPRLSVTLTQPRRPDACQSCGRAHPDLRAWRECDDRDQPQNVFVVLCAECSHQIIKPHPRLYDEVPANKPIPGLMPHLCTDCVHRKDLACMHPDLKANGGPGLMIVAPEPTRGFMDGTRGGKRVGWMFEHWPRPAIDCKGKVT